MCKSQRHAELGRLAPSQSHLLGPLHPPTGLILPGPGSLLLTARHLPTQLCSEPPRFLGTCPPSHHSHPQRPGRLPRKSTPTQLSRASAQGRLPPAFIWAWQVTVGSSAGSPPWLHHPHRQMEKLSNNLLPCLASSMEGKSAPFICIGPPAWSHPASMDARALLYHCQEPARFWWAAR